MIEHSKDNNTHGSFGLEYHFADFIFLICQFAPFSIL